MIIIKLDSLCNDIKNNSRMIFLCINLKTKTLYYCRFFIYFNK